MPHQLTLLGPSSGAVLRRGAVKANLIHHLAHAGGEALLRRLGRKHAPPRDWVPASGRKAPPDLVRAFDSILQVPTGRMRRGLPALKTLEAFARDGQFWAHVGLAFNLLRVWDGDAAFRESLAHADAALALEPEWAWGYLLRGEIKRSLIDYAGGAADLARAAELDPSWSWAHGFRARALFQGGTDASGLEPMDEAVRLGPGEGFLFCWRGEAYRRLGRFDAAARDFERGLELDPEYDQGYGWHARLLDAQGRHAQAAASLRRGLALCPLFEKARRQLVRSLRGAGKTAEALRELDRAARLNHRNDWLGVWRAEGQPDGAAARQALAELDAYLARRPRDARALAWKGETLAQIGRLPEAVAALDAALARAPRDAWARAWRGEALLRLGRVAEARADLDAAVRLDPENGRAWAWRGRARLLAGDARGAEDDLTRAISARRIEYAPISAWRGEARLALHRPDLAREDFDAAIALDPGQGLFFALRAKARAELGDAAGARADLDEARGRPSPVPESAPVRWGALPWRRVLEVEACRRSGRAAKGRSLLAPALARHGDDAPWLYLLRYRLKRLAHAPGALRDVDRAFRLDAGSGWLAGLSDPPAGAPLQAKLLRDSWTGFSTDAASAPLHAYRGHDLMRRGQAAEGLRALERAAGLEPAGWILAWLGEAYRAAGRLDEALAALDRALTLDPRYDNAYAWRATLKLGRGDAAGALADLDRALGLRSTARAWHDRARALRALGRVPESLDSLERAVRLNAELGWGGPKAEAAAAALAEIRALDAGQDPRLAEWEGETLLRLGRPGEALAALKDAATAWGLAWRGEARLALEGLSAAAARDLADAARRDPRWAKARALAAEAAFRAGDRAKALAHASAAVKANPYSARLRVLRAKAALWTGRRAPAARDLKEALSLAPGWDEPARLLAAVAEGRPPVVTTLLEPLPAPDAEPKSLEFFVNYACNAKCPFCFNPPDATPELDRGLPLPELARRLLQGWREGFRAVKFIGGEVTVRDDLPQILGLARKIGYRSIQLTTNGIRLADGDYARTLVRSGVDRVRFSIHGHTPALHDRLVAVPGALAKIEKAAKTLKALGARVGVNYVLNKVNAAAFPETIEWLYETLGTDDVIVYFIRYQGFGALPENKELLKLRFSDAVGPVRAGFARLRALGVRRYPQLIHFAPCVAPELAPYMLDWTTDPTASGEGNTAADRVTLPDGSEGLIHQVTNRGKRAVSACAACALKDRCLGIEENYAAEFGESEFMPVLPEEAGSL
ncbi:MAG: tetratricopeptide repeat protein [Elusimicrobia bacterium]|nr:tetratricopeptide repeat protein [Elusimicrobiota bacterium]